MIIEFYSIQGDWLTCPRGALRVSKIASVILDYDNLHVIVLGDHPNTVMMMFPGRGAEKRILPAFTNLLTGKTTTEMVEYADTPSTAPEETQRGGW